MENKLVFKDAEEAKKSIMMEQQKEIAKLYEDWADDIAKQAEYYSHKFTSSAFVSERYYKQLRRQLRKTSQEVSNEIYNKIKSNMYLISDEVVKSNVKWLKSFGFSEEGLNATFSYVPKDTVERLVIGQIYKSGWSLSKRIWGDNEQTLKDIYQVMAKGIAEQKPIYDIAKDLESYVRPNARLPWNLRMTDGVRIYKKQIDYNAQRLARTLVQHSYQQSFISTTKDNPFILDYVWRANGSRVCELCMSRDGMHYKKDDLPMDHPNGMCVMEPTIDKDMNKKLADWFNSPDGTYPEIDEFASNFGYEAKPIKSVKDFLSKYGNSTKSMNAWYQSMTHIQKAEAKFLKQQEGLTWQEWYDKHIYNGKDKQIVEKATVKKAVKDTAKETAKKSAFKKTTGENKSVINRLVQSFKSNYSKSDWVDSLQRNNLRTMRKWCNDWLQKITEEEERGVIIYTGSTYQSMNAYLRGLKTAEDVGQRIVNYVDWCASALEKANTPRDMIVRRGDNYNMLKDLGIDFSKGNLENIKGSLVESKAFLSTSPDPRGGFDKDIEYVIKVPKGSQGMYVDSISQNEGEKEFLLNCGGKFIVEDVEYYSDNKTPKKIYMTLINLQSEA
nr:MAG: minor capsid protein 2 [Bacteriophage sp.]